MSENFYGSNRMKEQLFRLKATMNGLEGDINENLDEKYTAISQSQLDADFEEVFGMHGTGGGGGERPTATLLLSGIPLVEWYGGKNNEAQQLALLSNNAANDVISDDMYLLDTDVHHVYDLNSSGVDATAYLVAAIPRVCKANKNYYRILNFLNSHASSEEELFYIFNNNIWYSVFDNDKQFSHGDFDFNSLHIYSISVDNVNAEANFFIDGVQLETIPMPKASGRVVAPFNGYYATGIAKYFAVVNGAQSPTDIIANQNNILRFMR